MSTPDNAWMFLVEIGGTHTRLAVARRYQTKPALERIAVVATPRKTLEPCLRDYLDASGLGGRPRITAAAVAGRVRRDKDDFLVSLTNVDLVIRARGLRESTGSEKSVLVNDLAAVAAALPLLSPADLVPIGPPRPANYGLRLVVGIGTGFGAALLTADGDVIDTEAGHADLSAASPQEQLWLEQLSSKGPVSIETVFSGAGLVRLHEVVAGETVPASGNLISNAERGDPQALKTLDAFCMWLGRIVGNLVLSYGAWEGVYFTGGVMQGLQSAFRTEAFLEGLQAKVRFGCELAVVPCHWIQHPQPALLGIASLAQARL